MMMMMMIKSLLKKSDSTEVSLYRQNHKNRNNLISIT